MEKSSSSGGRVSVWKDLTADGRKVHEVIKSIEVKLEEEGLSRSKTTEQEIQTHINVQAHMGVKGYTEQVKIALVSVIVEGTSIDEAFWQV